MTGTLEILVGLSAVGKTSNLEKKVRSYRWTTRDPRKDSRDKVAGYSIEDSQKEFSELIGVDGKLYSQQGAVDKRDLEGRFESFHGGTFARDDVFEESLGKGELCGFHKYPDPETGEKYGFPIRQMRDALERGENLTEQIVTFEAVDGLAKAMNGFRVNKILYLAFLEDSIHRFRGRGDDKKTQKERIKNARIEMMKYLQNLSGFDEIYFSPPYQGLELDVVEKEQRNSSNSLNEFFQKLGFLEIKSEDALKLKLEVAESNLSEKQKSELIKRIDNYSLELLCTELQKGLKDSMHPTIKSTVLLNKAMTTSSKSIANQMRSIFYTTRQSGYSSLVPILYPNPDEILNAKRYYDGIAGFNKPNYFEKEIACAIIKMVNTQGENYQPESKNPSYEAGDKKIIRSQKSSILFPQLTYPYLPVLISSIHQELGDKKSSIRVLEEALGFAEFHIPSVFDAKLELDRNEKLLYILFDEKQCDILLNNLLENSASSQYGHMLSKTVRFMMDESNVKYFTHKLEFEDENLFFKRTKNTIISQIIDGLSLIEDRYNRLTGNFTSRWPLKQQMIDEETGGVLNRTWAMLRGESYIKY
jgi:guanylate kinase